MNKYIIQASVQQVALLNQWEFEKVVTTIHPTGDTDIRSAAPNNNYGSLSALNIGEIVGSTNITRTLMAFNTEFVPHTKIQSVKLRVHIIQEYAANGGTVNIYKLKRSFGETTATWNKYDGINDWSSPGAFGADDCEQTPIGSFTYTATEPAGWKEIVLNITSLSELDHGLLFKTELELNDLITIDQKTSALYKPELLIETLKVPEFTKSAENPLFDGFYGSVVYDAGNLVFFYTDYLDVYKRTSTDGITWSSPVKVMQPEAGGLIQVTTAWKEGSTWYMLYRSTEWGDHSQRQIGLATSSDGNTWVKSASNPVITPAEVGAWAVAHIDPWGIIKVGSTYYLFLNDVSEVPRQIGLATSTDLVNWTMEVNNPLFDGRYCAMPIKYKDHYYLFASAGYTCELYKDSDPRFLRSSRQYLGVVYSVTPGEWDSDYIDTPTIITLDINRDTFRNNKIEMYLCNKDVNEDWRHGYSSILRNFLDYITY